MVDFTFRSLTSDELSNYSRTFEEVEFSRIFEVFRLDFSVKPAKWVKMEKLEKSSSVC